MAAAPPRLQGRPYRFLAAPTGALKQPVPPVRTPVCSRSRRGSTRKRRSGVSTGSNSSNSTVPHHDKNYFIIVNNIFRHVIYLHLFDQYRTLSPRQTSAGLLISFLFLLSNDTIIENQYDFFKDEILLPALSFQLSHVLMEIIYLEFCCLIKACFYWRNYNCYCH